MKKLNLYAEKKTGIKESRFMLLYFVLKMYYASNKTRVNNANELIGKKWQVNDNKRLISRCLFQHLFFTLEMVKWIADMFVMTGFA